MARGAGQRHHVFTGIMAALLSASAAGWLSSRDLMDCEWDPEWSRFRRSLIANSEQGFPPDQDLGLQAQALLQANEQHLMPDPSAIYGMSSGMQSFFLNCNQPPKAADALPGPFCLYGAIAAFWVLARLGSDPPGLLGHARFLLGAAMRHSLDFMESSAWPLSSIDVLANLQRPGSPFRLPSETHSLYTVPSSMPDAPVWAPPRASLRQTPSHLVVWELGVHASLSAEPLNMWARTLLGTEITHRNLIQDQYPQWMPDKCEALYNHPRLSCDTLQDDITDVFKRRIPKSATSNEPIESIDDFGYEFARVAGPRLDAVDMFLCTMAFLCLLVEKLGRPVIGYFGHPLLFMVPRTDQSRTMFWTRFVAMAKKESVEFACDGPFLQMQSDYQIGEPRLTAIRTHALYTGAVHFPSRPDEVLVLDRPHESVLMCLIQRFLPEPSPEDLKVWATGDGRLKSAQSRSYPYRFVTRGMTDKKFSTFAQFKAVALWPYDMDLVTFYEFYSMAMPIFMPSHLSKYVFEQDHMWYDGRWDGALRDKHSLWQEPMDSPFNESSLDAVRHTVAFSDYFRFPHVQYFRSITHLLDILVSTEFATVVQAMARFNQDSLIESSVKWQFLIGAVLSSRDRS